MPVSAHEQTEPSVINIISRSDPVTAGAVSSLHTQIECSDSNSDEEPHFSEEENDHGEACNADDEGSSADEESNSQDRDFISDSENFDNVEETRRLWMQQQVADMNI